MGEVSKRSHVILIHEIVKYHISRITPETNHLLSDNYDPSSQDTHSSINESLEDHGYDLGLKIVSRLTLSMGPIHDPNKCMVFICRQLWTYLFGKQAKRLQSNSQGIYVVFSEDLYWMDNLEFNYSSRNNSTEKPSIETYRQFYLSFISGVLKGSLKSLGFPCSVFGEDENIC
uniref:Transport protein particle (TRAPP) component, putative n=1 Tax=Theileria annulata TaxID=5874 RepID=A0A3B0NA25_THEAN